jgi:hypothetical protein
MQAQLLERLVARGRAAHKTSRDLLYLGLLTSEIRQFDLEFRTSAGDIECPIWPGTPRAALAPEAHRLASQECLLMRTSHSRALPASPDHDQGDAFQTHPCRS